jgi:putative oxidoreductase
MKNINTGILILRLSVGILMLLHGIAKISKGVGGIINMLESKGLPDFIAYGVYIGEIIAPILIIIGYRTRFAAAIFVLNMLVILFLAHSDDIFKLNQHGAWQVELIGLYLFGALALYFTGGGKYAVSSSNKWD